MTPLFPMIVAVMLNASTIRAADQVPSCVSCHGAAEGVPYMEHNFTEWANSIHGKAGVSCDQCHGGNPRRTDKAGAHAGMLSSKDSGSPVYFTRVPATCGACHKPEFSAFKRSVHYQELQRSGRGPNCVTCHGSMATNVLSPRDIEMGCTLCHRKPTNAYVTLIALGNASTALKQLVEALHRGDEWKLDVAAQRKEYQAAAALHRRALESWHTFDMPKVLEIAQEVTRRAKAALNEIHLKEQQKH